MTYSQVIILNPRLSKGLCASISARASLKAYINYIESQEARQWMIEGANVVALAGGSDIELRELYLRAFNKSLFTSEVYLDDRLVAVAIGPHINEILQPLVKHLKVL
jgi:peptidyl-tRNA hydrolase